MEEQVKFGVSQIGNHTPQWATWVFRIVFYVCSLLILALTTLNVGRFGLNATDIKDLVAVLVFITLAAHSLSKMVGVDVKPDDYRVG